MFRVSSMPVFSLKDLGFGSWGFVFRVSCLPWSDGRVGRILGFGVLQYFSWALGSYTQKYILFFQGSTPK